MGKLALADDSLWSYCKQYNPSKGYVVGLILGQYSKAADYIVHLARIPSPDNLKTDKGSAAGGDDLSRPQATSAAGLLLTDIKETWVANHACDVTRMLPGGMWVLGLFLIGLTDPFENQANCSRLRSILRHMRTELKRKSFYYGDSPSPEKLVLHLNVEKNLISCRSVDLDGSAFKQMEWKFQKNHVVWKQVESILDLHHVWHLKKEDSSKELRSQLQVLLEAVSDKVKKSLCLLAHELRDPEDSVDSIFKKRKGKTSNRKSAKADEDEPSYITANLYMPLAGIEEGNSSSGVELSNGCGIMYFIGSPLSRVFVHQKATIDEACRAVKQDIIRSIAARLEMHADSLVEEYPSPSEDRETLHEPPRRVMIKLPSTNVTFSDYLFPGEGPEEALVSSEELLDLKLELEDVEKDVEVLAENEAVSEWSNDEMEVDRGLESTTSQGNVNLVLIAVGAFLLAFLSFLIQMYLRSSQTTAER